MKQIARLLAVALLALAGPGSHGQPAKPPNVEIVFRSINGSIPQVVVEGRGTFRPLRKALRFTTHQAWRFETYDIAASKSGRSLPLRIVMPRESGPFSIRASFSSQTECSRADVNEVYARRTSTTEERLALVVRARELLDMRNCASEDQWKLAKRYFDTSCALAGHVDSRFDLSPDAQQIYRRLARNPSQKKEAEGCGGRAQQRAIKALQRELAIKSAEGDLTGYDTVYRELVAHAEDMNWAPGFRALRLTAASFHTQWVNELQRLQNHHFKGRRYEEAIELNTRLAKLRRHPDYNHLPQLSVLRLCDDRMFIINQRDKSNLDNRECLDELG